MRLNIGCGSSVFLPPWVNIDKEDVEETYLRHLRTSPSFEGWPEHQAELGRYLQAGGEIHFARADVLGGPIAEITAPEPIDAIYFGQVIEHLNPIYQVPKVLRMFWEELNPGGVLRITTPDLELILNAHDDGQMDRFAHEQPEFYRTADPDSQLAYLLFGASGPDCTQEHYEGHMHCYTKLSMNRVLAAAGFSKITFLKDTSEGVLGGEVVDCGLSHSMIVEAVK